MAAIGAGKETELEVMGKPERGEQGKTHRIAYEFWPHVEKTLRQLRFAVDVVVGRDRDFQHKERHHHNEYAVAERFEPSLGKSQYPGGIHGV